MRYFFLSSVILSSIFFFFGGDIYAAITVAEPIGSNLPYISSEPKNIIASIIQYFILLTSVLAVMSITWGGIGFILSTGDDEKMKKAKKTVIYSFVGLVVAGLAYSIVYLITLSNLT